MSVLHGWCRAAIDDGRAGCLRISRLDAVRAKVSCSRIEKSIDIVRVFAVRKSHINVEHDLTQNQVLGVVRL
jgi:hypothetical protein